MAVHVCVCVCVYSLDPLSRPAEVGGGAKYGREKRARARVRARNYEVHSTIENINIWFISSMIALNWW